MDQVWVCWADGDLSLPCVCGSVPVFWADEDLSLLCVCGSGVGVLSGGAGENRNPTCKCGNTSKVAQVKKEGPNKGRFFYTCSGPREKQCKVGHHQHVCVWRLFRSETKNVMRSKHFCACRTSLFLRIKQKLLYKMVSSRYSLYQAADYTVFI